jgi:hypothetical protein
MSEVHPAPFRNESVRYSDLPDYRDADFEPVAATFRRYTLVSTAVIAMAALLVPVSLQLARDVPWTGVLVIAGGVLAAAVLVGVYRWIDAGFRGWALREHDLIAREGVLWRAVTALPIARIQHVETTSGPLERSLNLARLKLYTAGGTTADLTVIGLAAPAADRLREHLVEQIRLRDAAGDAGPVARAADADADAHEREQ